VLDEFGTPFSFSQELTSKITRGVKERTSKPVIVKLSPNTPNIVDVAKSAEGSGADALCILNTAGPGMVIDAGTGVPVLWNKTGGISGNAILPLTIKNVFDIYRAVSIPIIGTGGISDTDSALQLMMAGATLYGIGSAIYTKGLGVFKEIEEGISEFLVNNRFKSSEEIIGISHKQKKISFFKVSKSFKNKVHVRKDINFYISPVKDLLQNRDGSIKTLFFEHADGYKPVPGQFYMLWRPSLDQKPFSVSFSNESGIAFSVKEMGDFSRSLLSMKSEDPVGLLGPLGNGFDLSKTGKYLLVGGGIGLAPLIFSAAELLKQGKKVDVIAGGKTWDSINWINPLLNRTEGGSKMKIFCFTEDGSYGVKGCITEHLQDVVEEAQPDFVLVCGPEIFIYLCLPVFKRNKISGEASIERMMKCGVGICGSCSLDPYGDRVCVEGPVFSFDYLETLEEFGKYRRDESGTVKEIE
jgi:dihydroorotate dehydrogenase electron transfer subunit